jgi:hypothetical protein
LLPTKLFLISASQVARITGVGPPMPGLIKRTFFFKREYSYVAQAGLEVMSS